MRIGTLAIAQRRETIHKLVIDTPHPLGKDRAAGEAVPTAFISVLPVVRSIGEVAVDVARDQGFPALVAIVIPRKPHELHAGPDHRGDVHAGQRQTEGVERVQGSLTGFAQYQAFHAAQPGECREGETLLLIEPVAPVAMGLAHQVYEKGRLSRAIRPHDHRVLRGAVGGHQPDAN